MKSPTYLKLKEVLAQNPEDIEIFKQAGTISDEEAEEFKTQGVPPELAAKYYQPDQLKKSILDQLQGVDLTKLEIEPGQYQVLVDFIGTFESAARLFGLRELGIDESDDGYRMSEADAPDVEALPGIDRVIEQYAEQVAESLKVATDLPGVFYYLPDQQEQNALCLFYGFDQGDLPILQDLGVDLPNLPKVSESSFDQIIAALEDEGCHDMAVRLYDILRG